MNKGIKIWKKAIKIIPGGNGLLSKRPDRYLPNYWPTYFTKSKGINIWDLNKKKYTDFCQMGMGTCVLGYRNSYVDKAVKRAIDSGVNSTLNSLDEYKLAKKILKYNKFANQIKFARGGGEAMAIAIRLARAQTGKDIVAFSGYHGWHDWYLAANIKNKKNLDEHLVPGLDPMGVPKKLKNSVISIEYNNIKQLEKLIKKKNIAAMVIEGYRYEYPSKPFLKKIQALCKENKICLIVDEITSGWRETVGGIYKKFNLHPDIVIYGKAIGNGYAISSILGKKKFMIYANKSFVSSTAWTEKVGFAAANATIDYFIKNKVHLHILKVAKILSLGWKKIAKKNNIKIRVSEVLSLCSFFLDYPNREELYTFFTKEMLKKNYLANNSVWISYAHKEKDINKYLENCNQVFKKMGDFINNRKKFGKFEIRYSSLTRL
tara:strand:+ start:6 stop:1301 length:1296 start_codon:yes stop_codon:yes gene_type:complete